MRITPRFLSAPNGAQMNGVQVKEPGMTVAGGETHRVGSTFLSPPPKLSFFSLREEKSDNKTGENERGRRTRWRGMNTTGVGEEARKRKKRRNIFFYA